MKKDLAVVLVSGGMDSCVTAAIAKKTCELAFLHLNYGQKTEQREKKAFVDYLPARGFDASRIKLDTSLISETLDWSPNVEISQGLAKTWNWMKTTFE